MTHHLKKFHQLLVNQKLDFIIISAANHQDGFFKAALNTHSILSSILVISSKKNFLIEPIYLKPQRQQTILQNKLTFISVSSDRLVNSGLSQVISLNKKIGIIGHADFFTINQLKPKKIIDLTSKATQIIQFKSDQQIKEIHALAKKLSKIFKSLKLKPNINQLDLQKTIKTQIAKLNLDLAFPICITSGQDLKSNTCLNAANKKIKSQDIVCLDIGLKNNLFFTDMTRMKFINHPKAKQLFSLIKKNHHAIINQSLNLNLKFSQLPSIYQKHFAKFQDIKIKSIDFGHGIGFFLHETPIIEKSNQFIGKNIIFTLEPTFQTKFGLMRVEDMIAINSKGKVDILTT